MAQRYFDKFPKTTYSNTEVVDITKRVVLLESVSKNPYAFQTYELDVYERADQFSTRYYQDPFQSWLLYLTNKIVDPYYEWYLSQDELEEFITKKYGSVYDAQTKVKNYRNNWVGVENIPISYYNSLNAELKEYWEPVLGENSSITSYKRKQIDWEINTNRIMSYFVSNTNFIIDEVCNIVYNSNTTGKGQILKADTSTGNGAIFIQHVSGYYANTPNIVSYIYGTESKINAHMYSVTYVANNLPDTEQNYWKALTYYDYETDKNEFNKSIRILDNRFSHTAIQNFKDLMKG
jgi:hypothetical protein